jgi:hypothetical protein
VNVFHDRTGCIRVLSAACICALLSAAAAFGAEEETSGRVASNIELIEKTAGSVIDELLARMPAVPRGSGMTLVKARGVGDIDFLFENAMLKRMQEAGYRLMTAPSAQDTGRVSDSRYRLSYQIIRMSLSYPEIGRRFWFGAKRVERRTDIGIFAQLADVGSGDILWVGDTQRSGGDTIRYSQLKLVEDQRYEFTRPPRHEVRWSRLIEPVVVTGIIGGLVYLFFSNQSDE